MELFTGAQNYRFILNLLILFPPIQIEQCKPLSTDRKAITKKFTLLKLAQRHGKDLKEQSKSTDEKFIENQIMDTGRERFYFTLKSFLI